ncbi:MAG: hypothetical protein FIB04_01295 [Gammaproteobacteria bacterium]|nr:hypothetical protein [Gammaproteobacteria bacterium]
MIAFGSMLVGAGVSAQTATPTQVLDRVNVVSPRAVLNMAFDDPAQATPFDSPPAITTSKGFTACQLTPTKGLVCLDQNNGNPGRWVRRWNPVTATGESPTPYLFSCEDPVLGLDTSRSVESCTGITADAKGNTVVAGKRKSGYNLIKVDAVADLPAGAVCSPSSSTWRPLSNSQYCYKVLLPRDRPLLVDIAYTTLAFPGGINCTGVIGLEDRKTLMFFPDADGTPNDSGCSVDPVVIADSKAWGLGTKELLQGTTTVTFPSGGGSFALVVSNTGRVLAKQTDSASAVAFQVPLTRTDSTSYQTLADIRNTRVSGGYSGNGLAPNVCDSSAQQYGIRTSTKSGTIYVTDRNYCESTALRPAGATLAGSPGPGFVVATFPAVAPPTKGWDLTLGTQLYVNGTYPAASQYPALEPTLAPGISVDLSKCSGSGCTLTANGSGTPTATLSRVTLAGSSTGMTLFQVRGMPDCRWILQDRNKQVQGVPALPQICEGAILKSDGTTPVPLSSTATTGADSQYLDVRKLLPKDVTDQFATPLPQMLLQSQYRAQVSSGRYTFDGFFGIPDKGVQFRDTFDLELYIKDLAGAELGCPSPTGTSPVSPWPPGSVGPLLPWDLTVRISEKALTVGGPTPLSYTGILANVGCGSTKNSGGSFSIYAFNLELTARDNLTFVKLLVSQFYDLYYAQHRTAMVDQDGNVGGVPLTSTVVPNLAQNLDNIWYNAKDKLSTCIAGSNAPKKNEAVSNCQAFDSQMANYFNAIPACTSDDPCYDVANRRGELKARVRTIRHVFNDRVLPSMPPGGFDPNYPISSSGLPPP